MQVEMLMFTLPQWFEIADRVNQMTVDKFIQFVCHQFSSIKGKIGNQYHQQIQT